MNGPRASLRLLRPLLGLLPPKRVPDWLAEHFLMGRFATTELRRLRLEALKQVSSATLTARLRAMATVDVRDRVRQVRVPVLYLRATEDRLVPRSAGRKFARLASNARIVEIEGPHFLLQARPIDVACVIREFVRENCVD